MIRCGWQVFADGFLDFRIFQLKSSLFGKKSSFSYLFAVLEMGLSRVFVIDWKILATESLSVRKTAFKGKAKLSV